eukprot:gene5310-6615_t
MAAGGLNTVQTYIPWNLHQLEPNGEIDLTQYNVTQFLDIAHELGLLVILRPGPYICAEWDLGGLPPWILSLYPDISLRSSDPDFLQLVKSYWSELLPLIRPYLYTNGGPVIMVQVENEYGSYGSDKTYLQSLLNILTSYLGDGNGDGTGVIFHSTDGPDTQMLYGSQVIGSNILQTVDFAPTDDPKSPFSVQRQFTSGPFMNSEYYTGWITHYGDAHMATRNTGDVTSGLKQILLLNASVNFYMFYGGSNFGWMNGANSGSLTDYEITVQSYDYDSPITEYGDTTGKYFAIREGLANFGANISMPVPPNSTKYAYGQVQITQASSLFSQYQSLSIGPIYQSGKPLSMEELKGYYGFVLYETTYNSDQSPQLTFPILNDRATVYLNNVFQGFLQRPTNNTLTLKLPSTFHSGTNENFNLKILVENQGRVNYGPYLKDSKGIWKGILSGGFQFLGPYDNYPLPLTNPNLSTQISWTPIQQFSFSPSTPTFYKAILTIDTIGETFLSFKGLGKGNVFVNGFNVGRYWNVGPQRSIYIPSVLLQQGSNEIILFETLSNTQLTCIYFTDSPESD